MMRRREELGRFDDHLNAVAVTMELTSNHGVTIQYKNIHNVLRQQIGKCSRHNGFIDGKFLCE